MTTDPVNNKTLGGLTYNANSVKSAKKLNNGTYQIIFKSGETLTYPEQKPFQVDSYNTESAATATTGENIDCDVSDSWNRRETFPRNAKIEQSVDKGLIYDDTYFNITNVMGARFSSSKDTVSHVTLNNSSNTTIDLAANDSKWFGDKAAIKGGANNQVILDDHDSAEINNKEVDGEGTAAQKDY